MLKFFITLIKFLFQSNGPPMINFSLHRKFLNGDFPMENFPRAISSSLYIPPGKFYVDNFAWKMRLSPGNFSLLSSVKKIACFIYFLIVFRILPEISPSLENFPGNLSHWKVSATRSSPMGNFSRGKFFSSVRNLCLKCLQGSSPGISPHVELSCQR